MRASFLASAAAAAATASAQNVPVPAEYLQGFSAASTFGSIGGKAMCIEGTVPVTATSTMNVKLNLELPTNQTVVTENFVEFAQIGMPLMKEVMGPMNTVSGTWDINAMLCYPKGRMINDTTVQLLSHGVGFDKSYWNFMSADYSYVDAAADAGYTTFSYDRLGIANSAKPDPIQVIQAPLEVEILNNLATSLRNGTFASTAFQNVVGVGHSFGSVLTQGVTAKYPDTFDAAVLTGFSTSTSGQTIFLAALNLQIAAENSYRFFGLNNGFLVSQNIIGNQFAFFRAQGFPYENLVKSEATKQTVTFGELLTMTSVSMPAKMFTGPIDVVDGENDFPFCQGDCTMPMNQAAAVKDMLYPMASDGSAYYLAPNSGHGLNAHYSAKQAYTQIMNFVSGNGF